MLILSRQDGTTYDMEFQEFVTLTKIVQALGVSDQGTVLIRVCSGFRSGVLEVVGGEMFEDLRNEIISELAIESTKQQPN